VKEKRRRLYIICAQTQRKSAQTGLPYCKGGAVLKKLIAGAREIERQNLGKRLIDEGARGNIFRIVKQMANNSRDVAGNAGAGCVKDADGAIVVDDEKLMVDMEEVL